MVRTENPSPSWRAASSRRPTMAATSTPGTRRTPSRCTRPMNPVPKIAVLIGFIAVLCGGLCPPSGGRLLANNETVEEGGGFCQALRRREQAVFVFDGEHVVVAEHAQSRDEFRPPLAAVPIA